MNKIFYKYKSCAGVITDSNSSFYFLLDSLEKKYFYLTRPENLNDKDECKIFDNYVASYDDVKRWLDDHPYILNKIIKNKDKNKDPVWEVLKMSKKSKYRMIMEESRKNEREHFHILSLTSDPDIEKMWKNYANDYNGVCLGYEANTVLENSTLDFSDENTRYLIETTDTNLNLEGSYHHQNEKSYLGLIDVSYIKKESIHVKLFRLWDKEERDKIKDSFLKKNNYNDYKRNKIDWSYEKEARVIVFDKEYPRNKKVDIIAHYPDYVLKEVIFGHNIDPKKKKIIMDCIMQNYSNNQNIIIRTI